MVAEERYHVRLLRLAVEAPETSRASLRVRYLGRTAPPSDGFAREVQPIPLPTVVEPGSQTRLELKLRNTGAWTWSSEAVLPVQIGARIEPLASAKGRGSQPRFPLPGNVAPGESLEAVVTLVWPTEPGRYRVSVDLVVEDLAWFADRTGAPLAGGEVEVRDP